MHVQCEYAHAATLIEEEVAKKQEAAAPAPPSIPEPAPPSRSSNKTGSFSPEPFEPSETKVALVDAMVKFMGLDPAVSREVSNELFRVSEPQS